MERIEDTKRYIQEIREEMNRTDQPMTDELVLTLIERCVFRDPAAALRTSLQNGALIQRIFLSLRRELGILQPLAEDSTISEIMVNGKDHVFVERGGRLERTPLFFESDDELEELIRRIAARVNREINELNPIVDARLTDGSRVNAVLGNISIDGPALTIRKFPEVSYSKIYQGSLLYCSGHRNICFHLSASSYAPKRSFTAKKAI